MSLGCEHRKIWSSPCVWGLPAPSFREVVRCSCCYSKSFLRCVWIQILLPLKVKLGILKEKCRETTRRGESKVVIPRSPSVIFLPLPPFFLSCPPLLFLLQLKLVLAFWKNSDPWCAVGRGGKGHSAECLVKKPFFFLWLSLDSLHSWNI